MLLQMGPLVHLGPVITLVPSTRSTRSQAYHSDGNVTELINQILLIIYTFCKPQEMI